MTDTINVANNNLIHCPSVFYNLNFILFYYEYIYIHLQASITVELLFQF
jgi:hypothetical protein